MVMFRRKEAADIEGEVCPYCEFVNQLGSGTCTQCYYDLKKAPRDQGESVSDEVSNSIFDELMSDEDDTWKEGDALDVVLTLDSAPLAVEQYEVTNFESENPEKIGFMESAPPELFSTVSHKDDEITVDDVGGAIQNVEKIDFPDGNPLDMVPEPVPQGRGTVFSPSTPTKMDDDLLGHIGGTELPSLPPDDLYENKVDLNLKKAPAPTPAVVLPSYTVTEAPLPGPEIQAIPQPEFEAAPEPIPMPVSEPVPVPVPEAIPEPVPSPVVEQAATETTVQDSVPMAEPSPAPQVETQPVLEQRIWPWAASDSWDPRIIHREVVSALEQVKSGRIDEATKTIDTLGPHLSDENLDLIYHVGMVLKQIDRIEEAKAMLERAKLAMPDNEHVSSAVAHLSV
jgi:hypothetical protein|tara:strand:- start:1126 stop:2316 length:1191 start_codon:yes stop_codon:yes gene_type:complete